MKNSNMCLVIYEIWYFLFLKLNFFYSGICLMRVTGLVKCILELVIFSNSESSLKVYVTLLSYVFIIQSIYFAALTWILCFKMMFNCLLLFVAVAILDCAFEEKILEETT